MNRAGLVASLGGQATPEAIKAQIGEIEQLVASAAGLKKERGDALKISAVDFIEAGRDLEPIPAVGVAEHLLRQSGSLVSAGTMLLVTAFVIWFGVRPIGRALVQPPMSAAEPILLASDAPAALIAAPAGRVERPSPERTDLLEVAADPLQLARRKLENLVAR